MPGSNKTLGGGGFHHVAIRVRDFEKSVAFYSGLLTMPVRLSWGNGDGRGALLDSGDGNFIEIFAGAAADAPAPSGGWFHIALRCDDVDRVIEHVRKSGAKVTMEPRDIGLRVPAQGRAIRIAFFEGPDGESIELFQNDLALK